MTEPDTQDPFDAVKAAKQARLAAFGLTEVDEIPNPDICPGAYLGCAQTKDKAHFADCCWGNYDQCPHAAQVTLEALYDSLEMD